MTGRLTPSVTVLGLVIALVLGSCGVTRASDDQAAPPSTSTTTTTAAPTTTSAGGPTTTAAGSTTTVPAFHVDQLSWKACDHGYQCASMPVPVDHTKPAGPTLELGLVRRPATNPDRRIGTLLVNPGGPGGSATDFVEQLPLPRGLTDRFDIVGFDPRGVGKSSGLDCHSHLQAIYDADPSPETPAERASYIAVSKTFVDECEKKYATLLPFLGTTNVARDMDLVRRALGEDQISYLGYSYGTSIGQEYARLFPTRVRAMVLDGVVDTTQTGLAFADAQAAGFDQALDAYLAHCDQTDCGFGRPAGPALDKILAQAEKQPIPSRRAGRPATPGVVNLALGEALKNEAFWPDLSQALQEARDGQGDGLVYLADQYLGRTSNGEYESGFEIYFAVSCLDQSWPHSPDAVLDAARATGARYPRIGEAIVSDYVRCALWPTPPQPLKPVPTTIKGLPPVVVISTTGDPATPYENGVKVAKRLPGAVLITNKGEQHTVFAQGKDCVDEPVVGYLVDLHVPKAGITCS